MSLGEVHNRIILFNVVKSVFDLLMQCLGMFVYVCSTSVLFVICLPELSNCALK